MGTLSRIRQAGFVLTVIDDEPSSARGRVDDKLQISPAEKLTAGQIEFIRSHKAELIQQIRDECIEPEILIETETHGTCIWFHETKSLPALLKFRLTGNQGGGTIIGAPGDTLQDLKESLDWRYGEKLKWIDEPSSARGRVDEPSSVR